MTINTTGLAATLATFLGIWVGHVSVRKAESIATTVWVPAVIYAVLSVASIVGAVRSPQPAVQAALGPLGFTLAFDVFEMFRQQRRVAKGHAPANPNNPRHARIMKEHATATTVDLLKREPIGRQVNAVEAVRLATEPHA